MKKEGINELRKLFEKNQKRVEKKEHELEKKKEKEAK